MLFDRIVGSDNEVCVGNLSPLWDIYLQSIREYLVILT